MVVLDYPKDLLIFLKDDLLKFFLNLLVLVGKLHNIGTQTPYCSIEFFDFRAVLWSDNEAELSFIIADSHMSCLRLMFRRSNSKASSKVFLSRQCSRFSLIVLAWNRELRKTLGDTFGDFR